jgi:signal transduction histidine kinase
LLSLYVPDVDLSRNSLVELEPLVEDLAERHRVVSDGREVEIKVRTDLGFVPLAAPLVEQVFGLLIRNAIAHNQNRPELRIEIGRHSENAAEFYVRDDGQGVPEGDLERIFGAFVRVGAERHGTGLGLTLVRRRVEQVGGRVWATSREGSGLTVHLALPTDREHE